MSKGVNPGGKSGSTAQYSVGTTAVKIASADSTRHALWIFNLGANTVYIGNSSTVSTTTGYPILANSQAPEDRFSTDEVWAIAATGTNTVATREFK